VVAMITLSKEGQVTMGITWVESPVECGVWLRIAAEFGSSVLVHCGEFFLHQTAMLFYVCGDMHRRDCLG
jgi:hypothetical protein